MRACPKGLLEPSIISSRLYSPVRLFVMVLLFAFFVIAASAGFDLGAQSQSQSQSQEGAESGSPRGTPVAKDSADKRQSVSPAPKKASPEKNKPHSKHVYTNDDLSSMEGGISVVGNKSSDSPGVNSAREESDSPSTSSDKNEAYWRGRARAIRNQIAAVDQQIDKVKQEIAKGGPAAFDPTTGLTQNVIIVHDRNSELQQLEERKQNLEKQMDELTDEGRKAGANPGWFR